MEDILEKLKVENRQLTEEELDAIYVYLNMEYDNLTEEGKQQWYEILNLIDKNFFEEYENQDGRSEWLLEMQDS